MKQLTILVDMDDTIEDLLCAWVEYLNEKYETNVKPEEVTNWNISEFFPTLKSEQVFEPRHNKEFWYRVKPKENAPEVLQKLISDGHKIFIVTASAYEALAAKMTVVLFRYFQFLSWDDVIVTAHKQLIKGDVLIDDGIRNLEGGTYAKLLFDAPHNKNYNAEANGMRRVHNWDEAYTAICELASEKP